MTILERARAVSGRRYTCVTCAFIESLPPEKQAEADEACASDVSHRGLWTVFRDEGFTFTHSAVRVHRQAQHRR